MNEKIEMGQCPKPLQLISYVMIYEILVLK